MASQSGVTGNPAARSRSFKGSGFLAGQNPGIVTVDGTPTAVRVFVYEKSTHRRVAVATSDVNGEWRVDFLDENQRYYVIAFDPNLQFNAVIRDNLSPTPMT